MIHIISKSNPTNMELIKVLIYNFVAILTTILIHSLKYVIAIEYALLYVTVANVANLGTW